MIYTRFMLTPGVEWLEGEFTPKASKQDADHLVELEGERTITAVALMGFDSEADRWEVLSVAYRPTTIVRRVRMMFGLVIDWNGDASMEFDRGEGIEIVKYVTNSCETVIAFRGLMAGMLPARSEDEFARALDLANRLGVVIKDGAK